MLCFVWSVVTDSGGFAFGEEFYTVADLRFILTAQERTFGAAEGQVRHGGWYAYVNA